MNEAQALELASENLISVTIDHKDKASTRFRVGSLVVTKIRSAGPLWTVGEDGMTFCSPTTGRVLTFKRGKAMEFCIKRILDARRLTGESTP